MVYSHRKSGQPGKITRLMSCTDEQWAAFPDKDLVPTHRVRCSASCCSPTEWPARMLRSDFKLASAASAHWSSMRMPLSCCTARALARMGTYFKKRSEAGICSFCALQLGVTYNMSPQAPSFTRNPHNGDVYSAYNKPEAVIDWLAHNDIDEEFVLILDADMIMRAPFIPEDLGAKAGTAISAYYGYLKVGSSLMKQLDF